MFEEENHSINHNRPRVGGREYRPSTAALGCIDRTSGAGVRRTPRRPAIVPCAYDIAVGCRYAAFTHWSCLDRPLLRDQQSHIIRN
jgi:hypothetical protein